jgi:ABC-type glycerol-3-phosphate transport system permease component
MRNRTIIDLRGRWQMRMFKVALVLIGMMPFNSRGAWAAARCDSPGQTDVLLVQLFMGLYMPGNTTVTPQAAGVRETPPC